MFRTIRIQVLVTLGVIILGLASVGAQARGVWMPTGNLATARLYETATLLADGRVLVAGGVDPDANLSDVLASAELYDPRTGSWSPTGSMLTPRVVHTATLLQDGRVLVAGGSSTLLGHGLASAELYDPGTGTWTATGSMSVPRALYSATRLLDGRVLVVGGTGPDSDRQASTELYDPSTGQWTATGDLAVPHTLTSAVLLPDGRVLVAGGFSYRGYLASAELYDPATGLWTPTGAMATERTEATTTVLADGRVLVSGGQMYHAGRPDFFASAELYDPATGAWTATGSMGTARANATATLFADGKVLVAGGKRVRGQHPALAPDQYGATADRVGERLLGAGQVLHHAAGVPLRKVPGILRLLTGASVTEGALVQDAQRRVAGPVGEAYAALRDAMPAAARVHTDDTGWRVGGTAAFLMAFESDTETVYQIRARHRNEEVREVIGVAFSGVLITDRGRSYDAEALAAVAQQKCLAHLQRSISLVLATKWARGRSLGLSLRRLLREAHTLWQSQQTAPVADFEAQVAALEARLTALVAPRTPPDPDNQRLLDQLRWHHTRGNVLRFLADPRLEPTNNRAERALRPAVIARKVSQCSKNQRGADTFAAFASVTRTIRQRGGALLDDLLTTFRTGRVPAPLPP